LAETHRKEIFQALVEAQDRAAIKASGRRTLRHQPETPRGD
jgi:hypothetical protein